MKAQTKALLASVVVIALALSAVSGVTYSWWSDSEQTGITVNTGYVDVTTSEFSIEKGGVPVYGVSGGPIPDSMNIVYEDNGSNEWFSADSTLKVSGNPGDIIVIKYVATFSWSVAAKYIMDYGMNSQSLNVVMSITNEGNYLTNGEWISSHGKSSPISYDVELVINGLGMNLRDSLTIRNYITQSAHDVDIWDGSISKITPVSGVYEIHNASQLAWVAKQVNSGQDTFIGHTVMLVNDIDLNGLDWIPIGDENGFKGIFDGNNKTISNLRVNGSQSTVNPASGLFGWIGDETGVGGASHPVVKDLIIDGAHISGHSYVGGIVGYMQGGEITGCTVRNSTLENTWENESEGGDKTGGIVGYINPGSAPVVSENTVQNVEIKGCRDLGMISGTLHPDVVMSNNVVLGTNSIRFSAIDSRDSCHSNGNIGAIAGRLLNDAIVDPSNVVLGDVEADVDSCGSFDALVEGGASKVILKNDIEGRITSLSYITQRDLEIDLNGKTLETTQGQSNVHRLGDCIYLVGKEGSLTIKNGTMEFTSGQAYAFLVYGGGKLTIDNVTLSTTGVNLLTPQTADASAEYGQVPSEVIIRDSNLSAKESVFFIGTGNEHHSYVTIENSHLQVTSDGVERDSSGNVTGNHDVNVIRLLSDVTLKMVGGSLSVNSEYGQAVHTKYGNDVVLESVEFKLQNQSNAVAVWGCDSSIELINCSMDSPTNAVLVKIPKTLYYPDGRVAGVYETDYKSDCFLDQTYFDGAVLTDEQKEAAQSTGVHLS